MSHNCYDRMQLQLLSHNDLGWKVFYVIMCERSISILRYLTAQQVKSIQNKLVCPLVSCSSLEFQFLIHRSFSRQENKMSMLDWLIANPFLIDFIDDLKPLGFLLFVVAFLMVVLGFKSKASQFVRGWSHIEM